jgi:hypothetical protein
MSLNGVVVGSRWLYLTGYRVVVPVTVTSIRNCLIKFVSDPGPGGVSLRGSLPEIYFLASTVPIGGRL